MTTFGKNHRDVTHIQSAQSWSASTAIRMGPETYACLAIIVMHSAAGIAATSNSTSTDRQLLIFGLMLGDQSEGALSGIEAALDEINARNDLLSGYTLNYYLINSLAVSILRLLYSVCNFSFTRKACNIASRKGIACKIPSLICQ